MNMFGKNLNGDFRKVGVMSMKMIMIVLYVNSVKPVIIEVILIISTTLYHLKKYSLDLTINHINISILSCIWMKNIQIIWKIISVPKSVV